MTADSPRPSGNWSAATDLMLEAPIVLRHGPDSAVPLFTD